MNFSYNQKNFKVMTVYAKYSVVARLELWEALYGVADNTQVPWVIVGDFNVIFSEEKKGMGYLSILWMHVILLAILVIVAYMN